ncbi:MAG: hypothetical protein FWC36_04345 [Spirochaetes bacterium]|nr:hypothetical protein [Spirochaetota bacterium]
MVKKNVLLVALICIVALFVGLTFSCAREEVNPDRDEAIALLAEVRYFRAQALALGMDEMVEPWGRALAIYELNAMLIERGFYTETLPGLGQARSVYQRFVESH